MAVSYQQQALVRKVVYTGLIVALFTVSLLHRRFVVEQQGRWNWVVNPPERTGERGKLFDVQALILSLA